MKRLTIGVRGFGVLISMPSKENYRLITPDSARRYAQLLSEAARLAEEDAADLDATAAVDTPAGAPARPAGDYETFVTRAEDVEDNEPDRG